MEGLKLKYFVLNPSSSTDVAHAQASRLAILAYAESIEATNFDLAQELRNWVNGL